jgi:hypothetical protein
MLACVLSHVVFWKKKKGPNHLHSSTYGHDQLILLLNNLIAGSTTNKQKLPSLCFTSSFLLLLIAKEPMEDTR